MKTSFQLTAQFPVSPSMIYKAWLSSKGHSEMTGAEAKCSRKVGGKFTAWDEYISGTNKSLTENEEIVQLWRTSEFDEHDEDSLLTIQLKATEEGCLLTLTHSNIPEGESDYEKGWSEYYFEPMFTYFQSSKS
jgi:activator of HSP90 ATPase